jgi:hypothetical protein
MPVGPEVQNCQLYWNLRKNKTQRMATSYFLDKNIFLKTVFYVAKVWLDVKHDFISTKHIAYSW